MEMKEKEIIMKNSEKIKEKIIELIENEGFERAFKRLGIKEKIIAEVKERISKEEERKIRQIFQKITPSKEALESVGFTIQEYEAEGEMRITSWFEQIASKTRSEKAMSDTAGCLSRYEKIPSAGERIARWLAEIASDTRNGNVVSEATKWLSSDMVFDCISRYSAYREDFSGTIANHLGGVASNTKNEKTVLDAANCISKYGEEAKLAERIAFGLELVAEHTKSGQAVSEAVKHISKHEKNESVKIENAAEYLGRIAEYTKSEKAVLDTLNCISKFDNSDAGGIAYNLYEIARSTKSEKAMSAAADLIPRYGFSSNKMASGLGTIASNTNSEKAVLDAISCISKYEQNDGLEEIEHSLVMVSYKAKNEKAVLDAVKKISEAKTPKEAAEIAKKLAEEVIK